MGINICIDMSFLVFFQLLELTEKCEQVAQGISHSYNIIETMILNFQFQYIDFGPYRLYLLCQYLFLCGNKLILTDSIAAYFWSGGIKDIYVFKFFFVFIFNIYLHTHDYIFIEYLQISAYEQSTINMIQSKYCVLV